MLKIYLSPTIHHAVETRRGFCRLLGLDKFFASILALSMPILNGKTTLKNPFTHPKRAMQSGFSLLELILVLGLMSIIAIGSVTMLVDDGDWKRQDETEKRWDAIRKAIIGEPNLSLNGSPYVAGYVADMGRLPQNISELFIQGTQPDWAPVELYKKTAATNCTTTPEDCYWLHGGWRGPYLYTAGSSQYRDAWNNQDANAAEDAVNFGWNVSLDGTAPDYTDITVQSLGSDNAPNGTEYSQDFPLNPNQTTVSLNEWTLSANPITFNVNFNRAVTDGSGSTHNDIAPTVGGIPHQLELRIYRYLDDGDATASFANDVAIATATSTFQLTKDLAYAPVQTITPEDDTTTPPTPMPLGRFAAVIWCTGVTPEVVYDGDCDSTVNHTPVYFTLTHSTSQVTLTWNLP